MEWLDVAINIEVEGEQFYRKLSDESSHEGMKRIFSMLADDEVKHRETFEALKGSTPGIAEPSRVLKESGLVIRKFNTKDFLAQQKQLDLYRRALDIEKKSIEYYQKQLEMIDDDAQQEVLGSIIGEEEDHYALIDNIIIAVERPESWVEDAEFGLREDY